MIKTKEIRIVEEDLVVVNKTGVVERRYGSRYDDFQFPLTVSFYSYGKYD